MKKYFQSGIIILLILWLFGALIYLPSTQDKLGAAAKQKLQHAENAGVFAMVKAEFKGQEAELSGWVATAEEKAWAEELIRTQILLPGWFTAAINPVIPPVHNNIMVDPDKAPARPRPWLIVSLFGGNQRVDGVLNSAAQQQDILAALATKLPTPATPLNNQISITEKSLAAVNWDTTHTGIPDLTATPQDQSTIAVSSCDGKWTVLPATASNDAIAAAIKSSNIKDIEITHSLAKLRSWHPPTPEDLLKQAAAKAAAAAKPTAEPKAPSAPSRNVNSVPK